LFYNGSHTEPLKLSWDSFSTWLSTRGPGLVGEVFVYTLRQIKHSWEGPTHIPERTSTRDIAPKLSCYIDARKHLREFPFGG